MSIKDFSLGQVACIERTTTEYFDLAKTAYIEFEAEIITGKHGDWLEIRGVHTLHGWKHSRQVLIRDDKGAYVYVKNIEGHMRNMVYQVCEALEHPHADSIAYKLNAWRY